MARIRPSPRGQTDERTEESVSNNSIGAPPEYLAAPPTSPLGEGRHSLWVGVWGRGADRLRDIPLYTYILFMKSS